MGESWSVGCFSLTDGVAVNRNPAFSHAQKTEERSSGGVRRHHRPDTLCILIESKHTQSAPRQSHSILCGTCVHTYIIVNYSSSPKTHMLPSAPDNE